MCHSRSVIDSQAEQNSLRQSPDVNCSFFTFDPLYHFLPLQVWSSRDVLIKGNYLYYSHIVKVVYFYCSVWPSSMSSSKRRKVCYVHII